MGSNTMIVEMTGTAVFAATGDVLFEANTSSGSDDYTITWARFDALPVTT